MSHVLARRAKTVADEALYRASHGGGGGGGSFVAFTSVQQKSADFDAEPNVYYLIDCSGGPVTMTLPVLTEYDLVGYSDWKSMSAMNNITITPNGSNRLMSPATLAYLAPGENFVGNFNGANATWIFDGTQLLPVFSG
jgi:hypothetical protein